LGSQPKFKEGRNGLTNKNKPGLILEGVGSKTGMCSNPQKLNKRGGAFSGSRDRLPVVLREKEKEEREKILYQFREVSFHSRESESEL